MSQPHPLAQRLIERLQRAGESRVLDFASGSGRNAQALRRAGLRVAAIGDDRAASDAPFAGVSGRFVAAVSTHGLLHGTPADVAARVRSIAARLERGGRLYATFGSTRDARFGRGRRIDDATYAPLRGDEAGVAHAYFDRERVSTLLAESFEIESLSEERVDRVAGSWAHRQQPLTGAIHWFAVGRKR